MLHANDEIRHQRHQDDHTTHHSEGNIIGKRLVTLATRRVRE